MYLYLGKHRAMKTHEWRLNPTHSESTQDGDEWLASLPSCFTPRDRLILVKYRYSSYYSWTSTLKGRGGWLTSRPGRFTPQKWPVTRSTGGWVEPRAGLEGCGKSRPNRDSIPGPSSLLSVYFKHSYSKPLQTQCTTQHSVAYLNLTWIIGISVVRQCTLYTHILRSDDCSAMAAVTHHTGIRNHEYVDTWKQRV